VLGHAKEHGPETGGQVRLGAHGIKFVFMGKRGFGSRGREQSVAAIAGDDSVWGLLGCGLLFFIRMEGELPRRHG